MSTDAWMPRDQWEQLVTGGVEECPLCKAIAQPKAVDEYGFTVAYLPSSVLRLVRNQWVPGYCVLICNNHAREPFELLPETAAQFWQDMLTAAKAIERAIKGQGYDVIKMNYEVLGNAVPHVHAHITPRYYGDPAPHFPIHRQAGTKHLTDDEYLARVEAIRASLAR